MDWNVSTADSLMRLIYRVTSAQMAAHVQRLDRFLRFPSEYVISTSLTQHIIHRRGIRWPLCKMPRHVESDAETWISSFLITRHYGGTTTPYALLCLDLCPQLSDEGLIWFLAPKHTRDGRLVDGNPSSHTCASHPTHSALRRGPHSSLRVLL